MYSWLEKDVTCVNGPVPTGLVLALVPGLLIFDQMCLGTIMTLVESSCGNTVVFTELKVNCTLFEPTCATFVTWPLCISPVSSASLWAFPYWKVKTTSAAVNG